MIENFVKENQQLKAINEQHRKINGKLREENQKYKEVIDELRKRIDYMIQNEPTNSREYSYKLSNFRCEETYENQQKEFIEYLEYQVKLQEEINDNHLATGFEEVLQKFKEIIGG